MRFSTKLSALGAALLLTAALSGCGGNNNAGSGDQTSTSGEPASSGADGEAGAAPITLTMLAQRSGQNGPYKDMLVFQEYEKKTNIHVEWTDVPASGFAEKKNLVFASNELPDAFFKSNITPTEAIKYGSSGMLVPLEELIAKNAPNISRLFEQYPEVEKALTAPDGHIYALSDIVTLDNARIPLKPWINKQWLDKLGLKEPTTTGELLSVLRAFRDNDPNGNGQKDEIPILAADLGSLAGGLEGSFGLHSQMGYNINVDDNGKVDIWLTDDRYKQMLTFMHQLYEEKLMDNEIISQDQPTWLSKLNSGNLGMFYIQEGAAFEKLKNQYIGTIPIKGPAGDQMVGNILPIARSFGAFAISSANKHPDETMKWLDYFYGDEGSIFFRFGAEGQTYHIGDDGLPYFNDDILNDPRGAGSAEGQITPYPGGGSPEWINDKNSSGVNSPEGIEATKRLQPYLPKQVYAPPLLDTESNDKLDNLRRDIDTYASESEAKFIVGDLSFDKWDEYVNTLNKMHLDEVEEIYQQAFDRLYKS